jgi:tetratricopeptide (TPR) repeat protein
MRRRGALRQVSTAGLLLQGALATLAASQVGPAAPRRPPIGADRDTNSAVAYYDYGVSQLPERPELAADAFDWATRLDPSLAEPWYGRWAALLLAQPARVVGDYLTGQPYLATSKDIQQIDSMRYQALLREPLLPMRLDAMLVAAWLQSVSTGEVDLARIRARFGPAAAGWIAYGQGRYPEALREYALAIAQRPRAFGLRAARARVFLAMGQLDSAAAGYNELLHVQREAEDEELVHVYESKELILYTVARIHEAQGDLAGAREAYGRALVENLAFYPAHAALARLALAAADTSAALPEYALSLELHAADAPLHYDYGRILFARHRYDDAAEQFRMAIQAEPYYAPPYYPLAYVMENRFRDSLAIVWYQRFVQLAPATSAVTVADARRRLADLMAAVPRHP